MTKKVKTVKAHEEIDLGITEGALVQASTNTAQSLDIATATASQPVTLAPVANLAAVASHFNVTTDDLGELARIGADSINRAMFEITRAGMAFLRAQELLSLGNFGNDGAVSERSETGGFVAWINQHGLAQQRVYEAMRIAKFVAQLPQDELEGVLALGKVKVMLLASLPQEVIDQAAESGNDVIGKADLMTVAELKEEIRAMKRREKNYEAELERAHSQVKRLSQDKKRTTEFLLRTEEIRAECMALQLEAELPVNSLRKLFEEVSSEDISAPENRLQVEHLWIAANVIAARAIDLVTLIKACEEDLPTRPQGTHILSPDEARQWLIDYPMIENRHAAEAANRQERRDAAKPRGAGRPKGSTNKGKGE
ncbi:transposase (plasmid) [Ralstonia pseudosolanacearum]|uniref:transposase n=1 Tax=Ralstonia pseudosolanacearum TaxID=1310165 RepID=UPI00090BF3B7|nr:transposase [Ralstonia pseudosolanacearum]API78127.1 transposase [Ralstonia pseudosolanacearum]